ncbi:MAG: LacI family transcriptional regulator [Clostridiales bacterium]|nr:LacI family transcriptional regulator [Clostridiales bacterium]
MANKKPTLQDVADALGISRNTVSRALNNPGTVSEATRDKIFQKAAELGYKQFNLFQALPEAHAPLISNSTNEIAFFTQSFPGSSHFGTKLLNTFQKKIGDFGYKLSVYIIRDTEIEQQCFPTNFNMEHTSGIICLELFSESYSDFLCKQNIPLLLVDTVFNHNDLNLQADLLYMENQTSVYLMLKELVTKGYRNISFIGDRFHCQSFYERWKTYCAVMADYNISINFNNSILDNDSNPYGDINWLTKRIQRLPVLPDVFFCANDYLAISAIKALKALNISVPEDVLICGFDDAPESVVIEPSITTVHIPSDSMGYIAADLLMTRIAHPDMPYRTTYVKTDIIFRDSTHK